MFSIEANENPFPMSRKNYYCRNDINALKMRLNVLGWGGVMYACGHGLMGLLSVYQLILVLRIYLLYIVNIML